MGVWSETVSKPRSGNILIRNGAYKGGKLYACLREIQEVWATVTEEPSISTRRIQRKLGISKDRVWHILNFLQNAGYVARNPKCTGRKILIPFVIDYR